MTLSISSANYSTLSKPLARKTGNLNTKFRSYEMRLIGSRANRESQRLSPTRKSPSNIPLKKSGRNQKSERSAERKTASKPTTAKSAT